MTCKTVANNNMYYVQVFLLHIHMLHVIHTDVHQSTCVHIARVVGYFHVHYSWLVEVTN